VKFSPVTFADTTGHERAAFSHRLPAEAGERHDAQHFRDGKPSNTAS
jgi:hypothetical protein